MANPYADPAAPWTNPVKQRLLAGKPAIGATICMNCVEAAAHAAGLGYDFLWIEMEHSPVSLETLRHIVLATRGLKAVPFARPPVNELWTAKRVLDAGALGVIFPFTGTAELAQQAVRACRYPPLGKRGSGAALASLRWPAPQGYYDFADQNILVVAVVEEAQALAHIDQIAATPGLDVLFIGTSDLSFSLGLRGRQNDPALEEAIGKITTAAKKHGKILGRPVSTRAALERHMEEGFLFFQTPTELELMTAGARQMLGAVEQQPDAGI
jgi:2-keto-3-deoxy-L-rhamnonate aldolase RhmA